MQTISGARQSRVGASVEIEKLTFCFHFVVGRCFFFAWHHRMFVGCIHAVKYEQNVLEHWKNVL